MPAERKVVVTGGTFPHPAREVLQDAGLGVEVVPGDLGQEGVIDALKGAWGYILGGSERMGPNAWESLENLQVVCFLGTGWQSFIELPSGEDIAFSYTPHANARAVAEFTIALMLDIVRGTTHRANLVSSGQWTEESTPSILESTLGIIGLGHVGREVARMGSTAFDMTILYWNRTDRAELRKLGYTKVDSIESLCDQANIVAVTAAYVPGENDGLLGENELGKIGPTGYLVNTARAELVDPTALADALSRKTLRGAAFDGYYLEPTPAPAEDPYGLLSFAHDRFIVTPHCAYLSEHAIAEMARMAVENILAVHNGEAPTHPIG